ncbi:Cytochrome P450 [Mycena sanguinolenta]|uniref:Cytochrome P450 n=1 Tax=Mycena sanguinolenta TaxID=230812 RepID=A0A8H7D075_9AGAR|nr:Cytochrome P450 [Mycena sanguinolenta]
MAPVHQLGVTDVLILVSLFWLFSKVVRHLAKRNVPGIKLNGPPSNSLVLGLNRRLFKVSDSGVLYQEWAAKYGPVFQVPTIFQGRKIVLCDPKAVNHFYSMHRSIYVKSKWGRSVIANLFGRGLFWAEGESHKRQRNALTPAFSNAAIRRLTQVFYDSAHKLKNNWNTALDNAPPEGDIIDVEHWMNLVALDNIGIAGFSHDFRTLDGEYSAVVAAFDSLNFEGQGIISSLVFLLGTQFPFLANLPTKRNRIMGNLRRTMSGIADGLLEKTRREKKTHVTDETTDRSIIGLLLKAEGEDAELHMDQTEVMAQNVLLLAGYESTSISLTWALIELAKKPELQGKLREELTQFGVNDPTWDQLVTTLPYLDSVVLETLRLHPALPETSRQAMVDDILPISEPITTASGEIVDSIPIPKGTVVTVSIRCMNQSEVFWGPNAKEFKPERWLTLADDPLRAKEIQGHRHLITFLDGPRTCLGKSFALAEFKAVLSVLIKNFTFEFPDGPETEIAKHQGLIVRPKVAGQPGGNVPMRVRRAE